MARAETTKSYVSFVKGLITEADELTFPEDASADELNCILNKKGNRTRRLGFDFENSHVLSTQNISLSDVQANAITSAVWKSVAGDGNLTFLVVQVGNTLLFYDTGSVPVSSGLKSFTLDISTYLAPSASLSELTQVEMASGKGYLFIASEKIEPIYITYDPDADTISVTEVDMRIRDLEGIDEVGVDVQDRPSILTTNHEYNIFNQGWYIDDVRLDTGGVANPLARFFSVTSTYPANKDVWWLMKNGSDEFDPRWREAKNRGSTQAPRGHFILDPFFKDRSSASGISGITVDSIVGRPTSVAFYAGRAWFAGQKGADINDNVFYSQIIEDPTNIGKCHQHNDPTGEDLNSLIDTDGGVVVISDIGNVVKMLPVSNSLVIFATNGVWAISGTDGGFKATDLAVRKITSVSALSSKTVTEVEGTPIWWGDNGIYTLSQDSVSNNLQAQSLTDTTIKTFYKEIPLLSRLYAQSAYDPINRRVQWVFANTAPVDDVDRFKYDRVLNFDLDLGAFYPWSIEELATDSPQVSGIVSVPPISSTTSTFNVIDGSGNQVIDASSNIVVADSSVLSQASAATKFITVVLDGATYEVTLSEENNTGNLDWETFDSTGIGYRSFLLTGYELFGDIMRFKQAPYVYTYLKDNDDFANHSLFLQGRWDFASSGNSGKYTTQFQTYRDVGNTNTGVLVTRHKFRGKGKAIQLNFESNGVNKFDILGWAMLTQGNTQV